MTQDPRLEPLTPEQQASFQKVKDIVDFFEYGVPIGDRSPTAELYREFKDELEPNKFYHSNIGDEGGYYNVSIGTFGLKTANGVTFSRAIFDASIKTLEAATSGTLREEREHPVQPRYTRMVPETGKIGASKELIQSTVDKMFFDRDLAASCFTVRELALPAKAVHDPKPAFKVDPSQWVETLKKLRNKATILKDPNCKL